eukprot:gnl/Trimastix_PCT/3402.p1 GENE.gnl/Trimastix_PCT/3402~~gnl/Trimastix_PCT/3402.p1  ORF type:complete len:405 (-),score=82.97 gnl/Trimastix_PCT/3402:30-1175(-)
MNELKQSYERKCQELEAEIVLPFLNILDSCASISDCPAVVPLNGNSKELFNSRLTDLQILAMVDTLIQLPIEVLELSWNKLGDSAASALARLIESNHTLRSLDVRHNHIGLYGAEALARSLAAAHEEGRTSPSLEALRLAGNPIGNRGALHLAQALQVNEQMRELDLDNCELETESVIAFSTMLLSNTTLASLSLSNPRLFSLQEETVMHFAAMLTTNTSLVRLDLSKHAMRDEACRTLCAHLQRNASLQSLSLRCNRLTMEGGIALGGLLCTSPIVELNLSANRIADPGAVAIARSLASNTSLLTLDLSYNGIGPQGLTEIAHALRANEALTTLRLWGNRFDSSAAGALGKAIEENQVLTEIGRVVYYVDGVAHVAIRNA